MKEQFISSKSAKLAKERITYVNTDKVTRVEVIDKHGRSYMNWKDTNSVEIQFQDDNRTLKIFITEKCPF